MIHEAAVWLVGFVHSLGYLGLFVATFLESTFVPIPSAATMIPAGYLAQQGLWNLSLVWLIAISGTIAGSLANYALAFYLGRPFLERYGSYMLFGPDKQRKLDEYFARHGEISIFTARMLPGVRHVISFPAGLAKMNVFKFCLLTGLGGGLWMTTLMMVGYTMGAMGQMVDTDQGLDVFYAEMTALYLPYIPYLMAAFSLFVAAIIGMYVWRIRHKKKEASHMIIHPERSAAESKDLMPREGDPSASLGISRSGGC